MFPQGPTWQYIRDLALRVTPTEGLQVYHSSTPTLNTWRSRGAYTVAVCDGRRVTLETSKSEIKGSLLCDAEYLLDHITEHKLSIRGNVVRNDWTSPSWLFTTLYYWAFFSAICFTRLLGTTIWFMDRNASRIFSELGPVDGKPLVGGAFKLTLVDTGALATCQVKLAASGGRLHDDVWIQLEQLIQNAFAQANAKSNPEEHLVWRCLHDVISLLGATWLSDLRNVINYRPGAGYLEVTRANVIETMQAFHHGVPYTWQLLVEELRQAVARIRTNAGLRQDVRFLSRTAVIFTLILSTMVEDLHLDILGRIDGDLRWYNERLAFIQERDGTEAGKYWPFKAGSN